MKEPIGHAGKNRLPKPEPRPKLRSTHHRCQTARNAPGELPRQQAILQRSPSCRHFETMPPKEEKDARAPPSPDHADPRFLSEVKAAEQGEEDNSTTKLSKVCHTRGRRHRRLRPKPEQGFLPEIPRPPTARTGRPQAATHHPPWSKWVKSPPTTAPAEDKPSRQPPDPESPDFRRPPSLMDQQHAPAHHQAEHASGTPSSKPNASSRCTSHRRRSTHQTPAPSPPKQPMEAGEPPPAAPMGNATATCPGAAAPDSHRHRRNWDVRVPPLPSEQGPAATAANAGSSGGRMRLAALLWRLVLALWRPGAA